MKLTEEVLALHDGIRDVFILEEKGGQFVVAEEASRNTTARLSNFINESRNATLAPALILGAASQLSKTPGSLELVGILYNDVGIMFAYVSEDKLLAISTEPSTFSSAMQLVSEALPDLIKESQFGRKVLGAVKSVEDAGEIAQTYVMRTTRASRVLISEINYRAANHKWEVHGSYRGSRITPSREFQLEVDSEDGAIMSFGSPSRPSRAALVSEVVAMVAALGLLIWWLYSNMAH